MFVQVKACQPVLRSETMANDAVLPQRSASDGEVTEDRGQSHQIRRLRRISLQELISRGEATKDALIAAFITPNGELVPTRSVVHENTPHNVARELMAADELAANARANSTRKAYGSHALAWFEWAEKNQRPLLPADIDDVVAHLAAYGILRDETGEALRDERGKLVGRVSAHSIHQRLAAINALHDHAGVPAPGKTPKVRDFMRGVRQTFGTAPRGAKAALTMSGLKRILNVIEEGSYEHLRRTSANILAVRAGATAGQLARLQWDDVRIMDRSVVIALPRARVGHERLTVELNMRHDRSVCAHYHLDQLQLRAAELTGSVFTHLNGRPLTRQALHKLLTTTWSGSVPRSGTQREMDAVLKARLEELNTKPSAKQLRDRALLTAGWIMAARRSNLERLNWDDLTQGERSWRATFRVTKTDQIGEGTVLDIPRIQPHSRVPDPAGALDAWHSYVTQNLGYDPRTASGIPVFCSLDRHGNLKFHRGELVRITGEGINALIQDLTTKAGLVAEVNVNAHGHPITRDHHPFGAHSLRAGYVTEAFTDNKLSIAQVMEVTQHRSPQTLMSYNRTINSANEGAARKILDALSEDG